MAPIQASLHNDRPGLSASIAAGRLLFCRRPIAARRDRRYSLEPLARLVPTMSSAVMCRLPSHGSESVARGICCERRARPNRGLIGALPGSSRRALLRALVSLPSACDCDSPNEGPHHSPRNHDQNCRSDECYREPLERIYSDGIEYQVGECREAEERAQKSALNIEAFARNMRIKSLNVSQIHRFAQQSS